MCQLDAPHRHLLLDRLACLPEPDEPDEELLQKHVDEIRAAVAAAGRAGGGAALGASQHVQADRGALGGPDPDPAAPAVDPAVPAVDPAPEARPAPGGLTVELVPEFLQYAAGSVQDMRVVVSLKVRGWFGVFLRSAAPVLGTPWIPFLVPPGSRSWYPLEPVLGTPGSSSW